MQSALWLPAVAGIPTEACLLKALGTVKTTIAWGCHLLCPWVQCYECGLASACRAVAKLLTSAPPKDPMTFRPPRIVSRLGFLSASLVLTLSACTESKGKAAQQPSGAAGKPEFSGQAPRHVLVQLSERPTAAEFHAVMQEAAYFPTPQNANTAATEAAVAQLNWVDSEQSAFSSRMTVAGLPNTKEVYRMQRIFNGIVYATDSAGMAQLQRMPGVRAVYDMPIHELDNAYEVPFVGAQALWAAGVPLTGKGIKVGIIDTGIDYTHADFGGAGTVAAYEANNPSLVESKSFPTKKVIGGYDFAGANYGAGSAATATPTPDDDPLDVNGHGTHVAGTAAGLGVNADGTTYVGSYNASLDTTKMRIGPGSAPEAELIALKVFGDNGGSTALSALAIEYATDPNQDGNFDDRFDVVNLSLGSTFGSPNDASALFYTNAVNAGVVVVASAGNSNDIYFATGSPGATAAVISVAASNVGFYASGLRVNSPAPLAGVKPAGTPVVLADGGTSFGATDFNVSGDVVVASPIDACAPPDGGPGIVNAAAMAGKIALISRGTCSFAPKAYEAQKAGATGVIIVNNVAGEAPGMGAAPTPMPVTLPVRSLAQSDGVAIRDAVNAGTVVNVTLDSAIKDFQDKARGDTVASFSSRGPVRLLGQPMLKPDVAAPGVGVVSAGVGTGSQSENFSGTSMASPLTAGVMALLRQANPKWTPQELKALLMNTAGNTLYDVGTPPRRAISPTRAGAGRIDAVAANLSKVIAYDKAAPERVSLSFATLEAATPVTETKTIELTNKGGTPVTYAVTIVPAVAPPGVTVTAPAAEVTVAAEAKAEVVISLAADPQAMVRQRDATVVATTTSPLGNLPRNWLSETSGYVVFTPSGANAGPVLRVPYFGAPIPASKLTAEGPLAPTAQAGTIDVTLSGSGVDTRALGAAPNGVVSLSTPFELAYASPRNAPVTGPVPRELPVAELDNANLRYVGITSNLADGRTLDNGNLYFAINTWAPWGTPTEVEFNVQVRKAGATTWEFQVFNRDPARFATPPSNSDSQYVYVRNVATGSVAASPAPLNGVTPATVFVPTFYSDTMVLPVALSRLGLTAGSSTIEYQVRAIARQFGIVDVSPVLKYDPAAAAFSSNVDTAVLPAGSLPVRLGAPGTVAVSYNLDRAKATQTGALLMVHHHNVTGARAQMVGVTGLTCASNEQCGAATPVCDVLSGACVGCASNNDCARGICDVYGTRTCKPADCRDTNGPKCERNYTCSLDNGTCEADQALISVVEIAANTQCPAAGGLQVNTGFDNDRNGRLDREEITSTNYVCNGSSTNVVPEPAGANCASGGVRVAVPGAKAGAADSAPVYVCNGAKGDSAKVTAEPAGTNCATGGIKVQVGDGQPTYVCNGASATVTPEAAGMNCASGGLAVSVAGSAPVYVCNGASGQSAKVTAEPAGSNCSNGGVKIQVGSEPPAYACNGEPAQPPATGNCSSTNGTASALWLLAVAGLMLRRRR